MSTTVERSHNWPLTAPPGEHDALITALLAQFVVVIAGFDPDVGFGLSGRLAIAVVLLPVWLPTLRRYSFAAPIALLALAAIGAGLALSSSAAVSHSIDPTLRRLAVTHLLDGVAVMGLVLWARGMFPLHRVAALFGLGALAAAYLQTGRSWKFDLAVPTTILVIGALDRLGRHVAPAIAILVLGLYGILDEGRSYFAFCVTAAALTIWQLRPRGGQSGGSRWFPAVLLVGVGAAIYGIATSLLTSGYFGPVLQQRSIAQIDATGSLIAGGRPEWSATRALMENRPQGYGIGVVPDLQDLMTAKSGLASINVDTGGYLNNYMLGGQFRLHSVIADLWVSFGWVGLVLAAVIIVALVRSLSYLIADGRAATIVIFTTTLAIWHMAFGPIFSNWDDVCLALGLTLLPVAGAPLRSRRGLADQTRPQHRPADVDA